MFQQFYLRYPSSRGVGRGDVGGKFGFGGSISENIYVTYVLPDSHRTGHFDIPAKNIYFKAWKLKIKFFIQKFHISMNHSKVCERFA